MDKLPKIGAERVAEEMAAAAGASPEQAREVLRLAEISGTNDDVLRQLDPLVAGSELGQAGAGRLKEILDGAAAGGVPAARVRLDLSIARGLDYYTGTVLETFLDALPGIGSVCSGGRYDNLAALYTAEELPGIGALLGLDRLLAAMEELKMIEKVSTPAPVFIPYFDASRLHDYLRLAGGVARGGDWGRSLPRAEEVRPAVEVRRSPRLSRRADCRAERIRLRRLSDQGPSPRRAAGRAAGRRRGRGDRGGEEDSGQGE